MLAPADAVACPTFDAAHPCASETRRTPALPVELNGVSVSINGAAAGLYSVDADSKQINFVVPISLTRGLATVAIANGNTLLRAPLQIVPGQPDIFTTSNDEGGRAVAFNVTDPMNRTLEPFSVTTTPPGGTAGPSIIELDVTGVRGAATSEITVTVGTTAITPIVSVQPNPEMPGWDLITFTLPASLAGAGDVPIQVTFTRVAPAFSAVSRPAATAPHITIN